MPDNEIDVVCSSGCVSSLAGNGYRARLGSPDYGVDKLSKLSDSSEQALHLLFAEVAS